MTVTALSSEFLAGHHTDGIQSQFADFHAANPDVYDRLVQMTEQLVARGRTKVGMKMLFEVLRWEHLLRTTDPNSDFKLNNNYTAHYARLIMQQEAHLSDVFEVRGLRS